MAKTKTQTAKEKANGTDNSKAKSRLEKLGCKPTIPVQIGEQTILATAREFSTGSVGYFGYGQVILGEEGQKFQVSLNITGVKTKPE